MIYLIFWAIIIPLVFYLAWRDTKRHWRLVELGIQQMLKEKKSSIVMMVRFIFRTYEIFHGEPSAPPVEIIKQIIKVIVEISPMSVHLRMKCPGLCNQVLDRVVEKIYRLAEKELKEKGEISYIY